MTDPVQPNCGCKLRCHLISAAGKSVFVRQTLLFRDAGHGCSVGCSRKRQLRCVERQSAVRVVVLVVGSPRELSGITRLT
jgi:hypothetical protein